MLGDKAKGKDFIVKYKLYSNKNIANELPSWIVTVKGMKFTRSGMNTPNRVSSVVNTKDLTIVLDANSGKPVTAFTFEE